MTGYSCIGEHLGQSEEVGGADEEVAVEGADAEALGTADAHDGLPRGRPRQVVPDPRKLMSNTQVRVTHYRG